MPRLKKEQSDLTNQVITPSKPKKQQSSSKVTLQVLIFRVDEADKMIDPDCLKKVEEALEGIQGDKIYLVIHTSGGDPFSAVRIMRVIQNKFTNIISIIPSHAMSAGTLMALGSNEIYMQPKSMLGPLDLPIEHPNDGSRISALDLTKTITTIAELSDAIAEERFKFLRETCELGKRDAARIALETATSFVKPIIEQVDPYHLHKSDRELKIGWWYAYDLLRSRMIKDDDLAWDIATNLVNKFPAHDYGIFADDAEKELNLTIKKLERLSEWEVIKPVFDTINSKDEDAIVREEVEYNA